MLDDGWQRHGEGLGELAHRALAAAQPDQHGAAGGIGQRAEDCVEPAYLIVNHKVQCARELRTCQAAGKTDGRTRLSAPRCLELTAPFLNRRLQEGARMCPAAASDVLGAPRRAESGRPVAGARPQRRGARIADIGVRPNGDGFGIADLKLRHSSIAVCRATAKIYTGSASPGSLAPGPDPVRPCFDSEFSHWHAICTKSRAMPRIQSHNRDATVEPAPAYATEAEIELAQRLRQQLEEQYLGPLGTSSPARDRSDQES